MKNQNAKSFRLQSHASAIFVLHFFCLLVLPLRVSAPVDPPGCDAVITDPGDGSLGGMYFNVAQAHIGDTVQVLPNFWRAPLVCRAINATGSVWIATGRLTNFLINATLDPGVLISCPSNSRCEPGPYNVAIAPGLVGAGVTSPFGTIGGVLKTVRAVENGEALVLNGDPPMSTAAFYAATLPIVTPCIRVVQIPSYPCFAMGLLSPVQFLGYVTNCGDIRLTNVMVVNSRSAQLWTINNDMLFAQPLTLDPGQSVGFRGSFQPTAQDTSAGSATNEITATARDTTTIGGPNAFVTNSTAFSWPICPGDPPGCTLTCGEYQCGSQGGLNFNVAQAHLGDMVSLVAALGMPMGACRAINATGSIWIATGRLTNFLINVTLDPGSLITCPSNGLCQPGPYNVPITPALVGAGVNTPNGSIPSISKVVRAVQNGQGTLLTGDPPELIADFHTASVLIVAPCIRVVERCAYPPGTTCFPANAPIQFTGYVTNCGDIRLTNVMVTARSDPLLATNGSPLSQPLTLDPGQKVEFQWSFQPTAEEIAAGSATSALFATGRDTTTIGGPNAFVTNWAILSCALCPNPVLALPAYTADNQFQFNLTGSVGANYVIQAATNLATPNWLSLLTNAAPFTFSESNASIYSPRFYRAVFLP